MTTNHLFDIASLTKVIGTTTAILWLVDQKKISIEDPISQYIPALDSGEKKAITIRHLLTHTAGLMEWYPLYYRSSDRASTYRLIAQLPLKYPVGKERHYSDLGFTLLGQLIENVSGQPLDEFLQEKIFRPLGMKHTLFNPKASGQAFAYAATSAGNPYEKRMVHDPSLGFVFKEIDPDQWNNWRMYRLQGEVNDGNAFYAGGGISGAAGLFSTVDDLQLLVDLLLNDRWNKGKQLISRRTIHQFLTQDNFKNGLGWMMDAENSFMKNAPVGSFGHTGFTGTSIVAVPECRLSVILLINRQNLGLTSKGEYINLSPLRQELFQTARLLCEMDKKSDR
jgi:CubicO group peptidase (beta-lactamase class C family)